MPRKISKNKPTRRSSLIGQLRADEFQRLERAFRTWLEEHDSADATAQEIAAAFVASNQELLQGFARSFVTDLARQRSLWAGGEPINAGAKR